MQGNDDMKKGWPFDFRYMPPRCNKEFDGVNTKVHVGWHEGRLKGGVPFWAEKMQLPGQDGGHEWVTFILPVIPDLYHLTEEERVQEEPDQWEAEIVETPWRSILCQGMELLGQILEPQLLFKHIAYLEQQGALLFNRDERNGILIRVNDLDGLPVTVVVVMTKENGREIAKVPLSWQSFKTRKKTGKVMDQIALWWVHDSDFMKQG